eukprot:5393138-Pyramimonas_sp.AAC.1
MVKTQTTKRLLWHLHSHRSHSHSSSSALVVFAFSPVLPFVSSLSPSDTPKVLCSIKQADFSAINKRFVPARQGNTTQARQLRLSSKC